MAWNELIEIVLNLGTIVWDKFGISLYVKQNSIISNYGSNYQQVWGVSSIPANIEDVAKWLKTFSG